MGLSQVWSSLINFALKSSPAKLVGSLEQKLYSNSGFFNFFFFNIGCSHPISCLLFSLQSDLEPHFFMWFFFFFLPLYLLLMKLLLFLTPFTHQPGHLLYQGAWDQAGAKRHCPPSWVSCPCPRSHGKSHLSSRDPGWSTPSTNQYLQGS